MFSKDEYNIQGEDLTLLRWNELLVLRILREIWFMICFWKLCDFESWRPQFGLYALFLSIAK